MLELMRHVAARHANHRWSDFIALPDDEVFKPRSFRGLKLPLSELFAP